ncbi:MAG TPA: biopolymer transporter ExbD [Burkholderiaceae bacterium]|jgi:biopolymer transport protein ExbD|nr:biopolymer transporter ExbD [Burkholderiaceae bacterium]
MGMNIGTGGGSGDPEVMVEMNMTPLIDVMLVLIIMLIITIPIQNHSVNLNLPVGTPPPPLTPPVVVTIGIDFDGTLTWNDETVDRSTVDSRLATVAATPDQPEVHLKPNKLAEYKYVAAVMASAQRQGVTKIGLIGNEQYVQ